MIIKLVFINICISVCLLAKSNSNEVLFSHLDNNNGLSQNHVNCIYKDSKGFIWVGTMSGLNRYDGTTFKVFKHSQNDTNSIKDNFTNSLLEDHLGKIWISTRDGYDIYDPVTESFIHQLPSYLTQTPVTLFNISAILKDHSNNLWFVLNNYGLVYYNTHENTWKHLIRDSNDTTSIYSNNITAIVQDSNNDFWTINRNGIIEKIGCKDLKVLYRNYSVKSSNEELSYYSMTIDTNNDLWFFSTDAPKGVYCMDIKTKNTARYNEASIPSLNTNIIRTIAEGEDGLIWIGTDHGGINILDKKRKTVKYVLSVPDNENSLSQNAITSLYLDNTGIMWIGTFKKGLDYYHPNMMKFKLYKHELGNPNSIKYDDIDCFAEDKKGNFWIGTNGGGIFYFDRKTEQFKNYVHNPSDPNSLSNNIIIRLYIDKSDRLWIGTYFGGLDCFDGKKFTHYKNNPADPQSIADNRVWEIFEDSENNMWIGTLGSGLDLFDRDKGVFYHYKSGEANSVQSDFILYITEDKDKNIWFATAEGVDVLHKSTGKFTHYSNQVNNNQSLSNNNAICILPDSKGFVWIGTREGLNMFDPVTKKFKNFIIKDGLPDNTIHSLLEDKQGNIWVATPNGLSKLAISNDSKGKKVYRFYNYDRSDGLQGKEFNEKACLETSRGELVFGGVNGFNIFYPEAIKTNAIVPPVVITSLKIFNQPINVNEKINRRVILEKSIIETEKITLKHVENIFVIDFAALNYLHPERNKYLYKLEGFNTDWQPTGNNQPRATYTNLDPGEYVFRVKASNDDGSWNEKGVQLKIEILPPFWRSAVAYFIYIILLLGLLLFSRRILLDRTRMKYSIENERKEAQRLHELDMMKIKFFTNISHEFRTPLTLILSPIEKIINSSTNPDQKTQFTLIQRNAKRLLNLVNQLLDIRKMEVQEFKLNPQPGDLVLFVKDISYSFSDICEKKNIKFAFHSNIASLTMLFDPDKLEKILFNLLSNAFKFTYEEGLVKVEVEYYESDVNGANNPKVAIKVIDSGIGIPKDKHDRIFEQFFQNETPGNIINQGSGVGLALTKEFVRLHKGTIAVESEPDKGSCFTVILPVYEYTGIAGHGYNIEEEIKPAEPLLLDDERIIEKHKSSILIVEDNEDLRFYLKDNLRNSFNVIEAENGKDGIKKAFDEIPDLIVSDIMMPETDGIELCRKLKTDKRTSHIPIVLLTAHSNHEQKMTGFEAGADDYIAKPFSFEILESRIRNLIAQRESLRKAFHHQIDINPSDIPVASLDEKLIKKGLEVVEKNIANTEFSVEELSKELGMSRVHLYKKILSLTGKTPIEFIRIIRLKRAAQLLQKSQLTVSEISFKVGFNNPKYFAKYFREEFGILPSIYAQQAKEKFQERGV